MKHSDKQGRTLRILTYNVHRWLGTDRQISPNRITDVIASCNPDIVALQEVRVGRVRPGEIDQFRPRSMKSSFRRLWARLTGSEHARFLRAIEKRDVGRWAAEQGIALERPKES